MSGTWSRTSSPILLIENEHPKPYKWKAAGSDILDKIHRARIAMTTQR